MELNLKIPDDIYLALKFPDGQKEELLLIELAISLHERGYLSFGKARQLSKMTKWDFHDELGRRKIERHYDSFAMEEDIDYGQSNPKNCM
jgi:predicted HTH domain antitoxin